MHKSQELIRSADAAAMLAIDRSTLSRWVKAGKLTPAVEGSGIRGERFFAREDVEALAAKPAALAQESKPLAS